MLSIMCHFIDSVDITHTVLNFSLRTKQIYFLIYMTFSDFKDLKIVGDFLALPIASTVPGDSHDFMGHRCIGDAFPTLIKQ